MVLDILAKLILVELNMKRKVEDVHGVENVVKAALEQKDKPSYFNVKDDKQFIALQEAFFAKGIYWISGRKKCYKKINQIHGDTPSIRRGSNGLIALCIEDPYAGEEYLVFDV